MPQHQYGLDGLTVLHLTQPVEGGVARVVTDLVRAQVRAGARVVVGCPAEGSLPRAAAESGAEVVRWAARRSPGPGLVREVRAAARLIRAARPDLLHLHSSKAGLAGRLAARGRLPTVFQPHAWSYEAASGLTAKAAVRWERGAARWADRVLCVSDAERSSGERHGVRAAWAVLPNGVDTVRFTPPVRRDGVRAALPALSDLGPGTPLVVCVGRLCPQKGQDVLLRAWPEVGARLPEARLVLVGDGPDHRRLLADAPEGVLLAGAARDPLPWYRAADVVVQPSRWEGMALAPLEAMACGRPVVLTDVGGARECVPPADVAGCVVPVGDPAALAGALLRLLTDPARRAAAGLRALARVRDRHDVRATAGAVTALYGELLALPAPSPEPEPQADGGRRSPR
ncbi:MULTISPECIES: glycosyltransferase family 4 protein [unclassified Streptomyces]|uniref:glycosyltransferase family 4 protein n=1 Tax=unclassified Streptomyces TaxID=2593676 RepID=UPI002E28979D|nr:glycosyltransferase family 4 protein [Streptomyces sp. NBC_00223]